MTAFQVGSPRRILIVSASMGDGHLQVSRELERRLAARGHIVAVADLLALMPRPAGHALRRLYPWMVNRAPWLYSLVYQHFFLQPQTRAERVSAPVRLSLPGLLALVRRFNPSVVVSTYHLASAAAARLRTQGRLKAAAVTFITTFGVHDLWLHPGTDLYLCITPSVAAHVARRTGAQARVCEPVVRPQFCAARPPRPAAVAARPGAGVPASPAPAAFAAGGAAAARWGAQPGPRDGERVALVVAGSLGLGTVSDAVRAVAAIPGWRPVAVCGRNGALREQITAIPGAVALGWVDDMASLIASADAILDNAAGSTAKEALALGRPVITFMPLPGHGRHDAAMMQDAGLTTVVEDEGGLRRALAEAGRVEWRAERAARAEALFGADPTDVIEAVAAG